MNLKLFLALTIFLSMAGITVAQTATPNAAPPATSNATAVPSSPGQNAVAIPQPTLVTPTVQSSDGLNGLNQNFNNNVPSLNPQGDTGLNQNFNDVQGLNQNFNNVQGMDSQPGVNFNAVSPTDAQSGNAVNTPLDSFGTPIGNGVVITPSGIPVLVTNPLANPFNTGIVVNPTFPAATNTVNPNLPINAGFTTFDTATVFDTSGVQSPNGVQFPTITLGSTTPILPVGTQTNTALRRTSPNSIPTDVQGIVQRSDGTFTNVND